MRKIAKTTQQLSNFHISFTTSPLFHPPPLNFWSPLEELFPSHSLELNNVHIFPWEAQSILRSSSAPFDGKLEAPQSRKIRRRWRCPWRCDASLNQHWLRHITQICGIGAAGDGATHGPGLRAKKDGVILAGDKEAVRPLLLLCCSAL